MQTSSESRHVYANVTPKTRATRKPYCQQCKERRVKCDLQQPNCLRCFRRGRRCEYQRSVAARALYTDAVSTEPVRSAALRRLEGCCQDRRSTLYSGVILKNQHSLQCTLQSSHTDLSGEFESLSHNHLLVTPRIDVTACYLNIIHQEISRKSTLLIHPHIWTAELSGRRDDDPVMLAAFACGARLLNHHDTATVLYTRCIQQLRENISNFSTANGVLATTDVCATIMLLTVYELRWHPSSLHNFRLHLQGLAHCLRLHIKYYDNLSEHKPIRTMISEPGPGSAGLLIAIYRGFRNLESVQSIILGAEPLLSRSEYATLFDDSLAGIKPAVMTEVWRIMHVVASSYRKTPAEKASFLRMTEGLLSSMPWYVPDLMIQDITHLEHSSTHDCDDARLYNSTDTDAWNHVESISANLLVHASLLKLQSSIFMMLPNTRQAVLGRAAGVALLCNFIRSHGPSMLYGWCLLGMSSVCGAYAQLLSESDTRRIQSFNMLQDLCDTLGISPTSLITGIS